MLVISKHAGNKNNISCAFTGLVKQAFPITIVGTPEKTENPAVILPDGFFNIGTATHLLREWNFTGILLIWGQDVCVFIYLSLIVGVGYRVIGITTCDCATTPVNEIYNLTDICI
ncbi:hypothetical protein ACJX0J_040045 [Zea mays]